MAKRLMGNLVFGCNRNDDFTVGQYHFNQTGNQKDFDRNFGIHRLSKQNGYVIINGSQKNSIIFRGGIINERSNGRTYRRKFIDDLLVIGSLITGMNWCLWSKNQKQSNTFPCLANNFLDNILFYDEANPVCVYFRNATQCLRNESWCKKFHNGFHLRMLFNHSNIDVLEVRFLSMVIIWEWMFSAIKGEESMNLHKIFIAVMQEYWILECDLHEVGNVFSILRNQLAHNGRLPIDRQYANDWMNQLDSDECARYMNFFIRLTQVVVLKTLNVNADHIIENNLQNFLRDGQI